MNEGRNSIWQIINKRWLLCCLLLFAAACNSNVPYDRYEVTLQDSIAQLQVVARAFSQINTLSKEIRSGDLVTRTGNDFASDRLRQLNQRDPVFSHCGIASIENDSVFVYHALGGEFNPDQKMRRDVLALFAEPYTNRGIGLFRYDITQKESDLLLSTVKTYYQAGIMFDMKFDLASDARMYCTELVYKSFLKATNNRLHFNTSRIKQFRFIGVDDLYLQSACKSLKKILYK